LRRVFPKASYHLLEDPDTVARLRADPRSFLEEVRLPVILDEIQNVPEILNYVRARIDKAPRKTGRWLLTGSQEAPLMEGVTESMAGRAAVLQLLPFSSAEHPRVSVVRGGFPEVSVPTISQWLSILETTAQILLVPPFYENFGKRPVKSPKLHFVDSGLACHLLNINSERELNRSPLLGPLFEGFVASEIVKHQLNEGRRKEIYYFRDHQGLEIDLVVSTADRALTLIEAKASRTVTPAMAEPLVRLRHAVSRYDVTSLVVHRGTSNDAALDAIRPGVKAVPVDRFLSTLSAPVRRRAHRAR